MPDPDSPLAARLRELLAQHGPPENKGRHRWLANRVGGVAKSAVTQWLTGTNTPSGRHLTRLGEVFGLSAAETLDLHRLKEAARDRRERNDDARGAA